VVEAWTCPECPWFELTLIGIAEWPQYREQAAAMEAMIELHEYVIHNIEKVDVSDRAQE